MMKTKGIFAVSLIAIFAMGAANADIASKGYVDDLVDGRLTSISGSTDGTGNVVTAVAASGSTVTATKGITAEETKNKVTTIRDSEAATDIAYPSEKAVATALAGKADTGAIPTVNDAILTIQKNGDEVGTFTANASNPKTINITVPVKTSELDNDSGFVTSDDLPDSYTLNPATSDTLGGVKSGGDITVSPDGTVTVNNAKTATSATSATTAGTATKATQDASGNVITSTYATKTELGTKANVADLAEVATSGSYNDLTDKPSIPSAYTLPAATATALGGVKSGGDITVATDGTVTVNSATTADSATTASSATKATQDGSGNNIVNTYATKAQITALDSTSSGTGAVVTAVSQTDGKVSVTKGNVKIPVGGESATTYATIWIE